MLCYESSSMSDYTITVEYFIQEYVEAHNEQLQSRTDNLKLEM